MKKEAEIAQSFREDGRLFNEIRRMDFTTDFPYISLRQGNSHVRVRIDGPKEGSKLYFNNTNFHSELYSIFSNIVLSDLQLDIFIDIIEEDGSILSTIINCISLSMCHSNIPLLDFPCSITYSSKGVDLSGSEEGSGKVCVVYLMNSGTIIYYRLEGKMNMEKIQNIDEKGKEALEEIYSKLRSKILL